MGLLVDIVMFTMYKIQMVNLALRIVLERCGPLCHIVISDLFKEKKTIKQIVTRTNIPAKTIGRALLALLQFNYVNYHHILKKTGLIRNIYCAKPLKILQTLQLPLLLAFTRD